MNVKFKLTDPALNPENPSIEADMYEYTLIQFYRALSDKDKLTLIGEMRKAAKRNQAEQKFIAECEKRDRERKIS